MAVRQREIQLTPSQSSWFLLHTRSCVVLLTPFLTNSPKLRFQGKQYGITNEAIIGAFFMPAGLGNFSTRPSPSPHPPRY